MMDARTGAGKLRLCDIFTVVDHQGEIDVSVCQVSRDMPARVPCAGLAKAEHLFIKLGCLLQIFWASSPPALYGGHRGVERSSPDTAPVSLPRSGRLALAANCTTITSGY